MEPITDINQIKLKVLEKVAEYAYNGTLDTNFDKIPYEIIPGIKPQFRCCVYREREIIRQRIRLAMGKMPMDTHYETKPSAQIVHVIPCACEGCPITRFTVTSNCQNCLTKKCMKACKFGAIMKTRTGAYIDKEKCRKCGQCLEACPYHAIVDTERPCKRSCSVNAISMDENDLAIIDPDKCINCGACTVACPFGAISDESMLADVIYDINKNKNVYAMLAPSVEGQFGDINIGIIKSAVKQLGFKDVYEVALGADIVAYEEAEELVEHYKKGEVLTTSCCPGFVKLIDKHYPTVSHCVSTTVSPMIATARYIKSLDENAVIVFIGPCLAKKVEALEDYAREVDYVLTFEELHAMFQTKLIDISSSEAMSEDSSTYGKGFAKSGGVAKAALQVIKEKNIQEDIKINLANGIDECKKAILLLKSNKLTENFIEGMACKGGCINGPACIQDVRNSKKVFDKYLSNGKDNISDIISSKNLDNIDLNKK